ncbi:MAG: lysylphosphatidylglycerol synthase transmembrane domain-containing protein [Actinomycetota bacterium]
MPDDSVHAADDVQADPAASHKRKIGTRQVVGAVVTVAIVVLVFVGIFPRIADYSAVRRTIRAMTSMEIGTLLLLAVWNILSYLPVLTTTLPGLKLRQAFVVTNATTAVSNTVPAGGAVAIGLTYAILTSWGFTVAQIVRQVLISGVFNTFVKLGMPVIALALLAIQGDVPSALLVAAPIGVAALLVAIVLFWLVLRSEELARRVGDGLGKAAAWLWRLFRRPWNRDWGTSAVEFRNNTIDLLKGRAWKITVATMVSHTSLFFVLLLTLRHVGVSEQEVSTIRVFAAFAFARLISALPITPGGVGVVELGYVGALGIGVDKETSAQIVAAVLVFRALTYLLPIPLGVGTWLFWRANKSWRRDPGEMESVERAILSEPSSAAGSQA